jgi:hypothetical protein
MGGYLKQTTEGVNVPNLDKIEDLKKYQRESGETAAVIGSSDRNNTGEDFDHLSAELFRT